MREMDDTEMDDFEPPSNAVDLEEMDEFDQSTTWNLTETAYETFLASEESSGYVFPVHFALLSCNGCFLGGTWEQSDDVPDNREAMLYLSVKPTPSGVPFMAPIWFTFVESQSGRSTVAKVGEENPFLDTDAHMGRISDRDRHFLRTCKIAVDESPKKRGRRHR